MATRPTPAGPSAGRPSAQHDLHPARPAADSRNHRTDRCQRASPGVHPPTRSQPVQLPANCRQPPQVLQPLQALDLLVLVQVVLGDRLLLAFLGYDGPGDQVHERAYPSAEDRECRENNTDDVGINAEVLSDPGANPGDHAALTRPDQLLASIRSVHTFDHAPPGARQTARPRPHTLKG